MKAPHLLLGAAMAVMCLHASAQWQWLDRDGRKVFSDIAPPPDVPEKNILKRPGKAPSAPSPASTTSPEPITSPPGGTSQAGAPSKKSELELKLEEKKKQADQAEAAKRKAEEERISKAKAESCERARRALATLDSGVRMSTTNAKGEREFMDESARTAEKKRIQGVVASDCN